METRAHYVLIGAVMLASIVLAILFALWLGSNRSEYDAYRVVFTQKISGLQPGSTVLFNGIPVGTVDELELDQTNPNRSIATVRLDQGTPVKTDTTVELELTGVTGLAAIQFNGGSPDAPLLKEVVDDRIPTINANLSGIAAVLESSGDIVLNLQQLISQENALAVSRVLSDIESLTDVLADKETEVANIIDNTAVITDELAKTMRNLSVASEDFAEVTESLRVLVEQDGKGLANELTRAAETTNELLADINGILEENREEIDNFTNQGLGATITLVNKASRLVDTTQSILLEFDRNPTAFFLGEGRPTQN